MDEILGQFRAAAPYILSLNGLLLMAGATAFGILAGAIPGIGSTLMMSMVLPFTFAMPPVLGLSVLAAIWTGSQYGSSIPAILINTPSSASSVPTAVDGYALHMQGKSGKALGVSLICGFIGGLASVIVLMLVVIPLGEWALAFGPAEYFGVALFGLAAVSSLTEGSAVKTLLSGFFGLAIGTIGLDLFTGASRLTFGISKLADGLPMVPVILGLFASLGGGNPSGGLVAGREGSPRELAPRPALVGRAAPAWAGHGALDGDRHRGRGDAGRRGGCRLVRGVQRGTSDLQAS